MCKSLDKLSLSFILIFITNLPYPFSQPKQWEVNKEKVKIFPDLVTHF